jgi:alpha-tubulin suppressor-like RCC1 family protein
MKSRSRNVLSLSVILSMILVCLPNFIIASPVDSATFTKLISGGGAHTLALKSDGTVWTWGSNRAGQLGERTTENPLLPAQVTSISGVEAISGGSDHSVALKKDGTVWSWGDNHFGQLGNGSTATSSSVPVQAAGLTDVISISSRAAHTIALKSDGTVWTWGYNYYGQLGDGSTTNSKIPVQVKDSNGAAFGDVAAIASGGYHSMALKKDGTVWIWGNNESGQIGDGSTTSRSKPIQVKDSSGIVFGDVVAIAAGQFHSIALKKDGTVWRWGHNLADGTFNRTSPFHISGFDGTIAIASEGYQIIAIKEGGTLWRWGTNGTTLPTDPFEARDNTGAILTGFVAAAGGETHSTALKNDGTVWTWGNNYFGQLGNGTSLNGTSSTPIQVFDLGWGTPGSSNADLSGLTLSQGSLNPVFAAGITSYSVSVTDAVYSMNITPTAADPAAVIQVNGTVVASGQASAPISLQTGHSAIAIAVKASNGTTTKTYTINVDRAASQVVPFARLITNKTEYRPGDPVEVRLALDGFADGAQVNTANFHLAYDTSVFELATHQVQDDIVNGTIPSASKAESAVPGTLTYLVANSEANYPIVNGSTVFTVKLRVKAGASPGVKTFTFKGDNPDLSVDILDSNNHVYNIPSVSGTVAVIVDPPGGNPPSQPPTGPPPGPPTLLPDAWLTGNRPYVSLNQAIRMEQSNGQFFIRLDTDSVMALIENAPPNTLLYTIGFDIPGTAIFEIPSSLAKAAYEKSACSGWILVLTPAGSYSLPLPVLNANDGLEDGAVSRIALSLAGQTENVRILAAAENNQVALLPAPAVTYTLTVTHGEETKTIEDFGDVYVERSMRLGDLPKPPSPTPGIFQFDEKNGSFQFSPARFVTDRTGAFHAMISRTGNSTYVAGYKKAHFQDIATHLAQSAIDKLAAKGLVDGTTEDKFSPEKRITRAEFTAWLVRGLGLQDKKVSGSFADVSENDRYGKEVLIAEHERLVFGSNDRFRPNDALTREETAVMIAQAIEYVNPGKIFAKTDLTSFKDADRISLWALYEFRIAITNGILTGNPEHWLNPSGFFTRAQAVIVLERTLRELALTD